jgi:hypothetical protein
LTVAGCVNSWYGIGTRGGNWLLVGTLPEGQGGFGMAVTVDVYGNQINVYPSVSFACQGANAADGVNTGLAPGTLAADGSFSLTSATIPSPAGPSGLYYGFTLNGTYPQDDSTPWPGSFSFPQTPPNCQVPSSGNFTAVKIADVTGVYTGKLGMTAPPTTVAIAPTVQMTLQQGGVFPGQSQFSHLYIGGTLQVQGSPCVSSGTSDAQNSDYGGDIGIMDFKMNDGSTWTVYFLDESTDSTNLLVQSVTIRGGSCNFNQVAPNAEFVRQ